jgi:hypothetical protein
MTPLNLIPLLFLRPLRLFLSSEDNRRIRIIVLKATHFPFVALIWAFEGSQRLLSHPKRASSTRIPHNIARPFSASQVSVERDRDVAKSLLQEPALSQSTSMVAGKVSDAPAGQAQGSADQDLIALVQNLSFQIEDLKAMVAGQQKD